MYQYLTSVVPPGSGSDGVSLADSTVATEIPLADPGSSQQMATPLGGGGGGGGGSALVGVVYVSDRFEARTRAIFTDLTTYSPLDTLAPGTDPGMYLVNLTTSILADFNSVQDPVGVLQSVAAVASVVNADDLSGLTGEGAVDQASKGQLAAIFVDSVSEAAAQLEPTTASVAAIAGAVGAIFGAGAVDDIQGDGAGGGTGASSGSARLSAVHQQKALNLLSSVLTAATTPASKSAPTSTTSTSASASTTSTLASNTTESDGSDGSGAGEVVPSGSGGNAGSVVEVSDSTSSYVCQTL